MVPSDSMVNRRGCRSARTGPEEVTRAVSARSVHHLAPFVAVRSSLYGDATRSGRAGESQGFQVRRQATRALVRTARAGLRELAPRCFAAPAPPYARPCCSPPRTWSAWCPSAARRSCRGPGVGPPGSWRRAASSGDTRRSRSCRRATAREAGRLDLVVRRCRCAGVAARSPGVANGACGIVAARRKKCRLSACRSPRSRTGSWNSPRCSHHEGQRTSPAARGGMKCARRSATRSAGQGPVQPEPARRLTRRRSSCLTVCRPRRCPRACRSAAARTSPPRRDPRSPRRRGG